MKRICVFGMAVLFLFCTGCSISEDVPEESVARFWSQWDNANSAEIDILTSEEDRWSYFSVENAEGQKLTFGKENARGTMSLLSYNLRQGLEDGYLAIYAVPYSERYVITLQQEQLEGKLLGYEDTGVVRQSFDWDVTNAQQLECQSNSLTAVGENMAYDLTIGCNLAGSTPIYFEMIGQSESQVVFKQQDDYFLFKSEDSPCTLEYNSSEEFDVLLGESPAGQWSQIRLVNGVWIMEPQAGSFDE